VRHRAWNLGKLWSVLPMQRKMVPQLQKGRLEASNPANFAWSRVGLEHSSSFVLIGFSRQPRATFTTEVPTTMAFDLTVYYFHRLMLLHVTCGPETWSIGARVQIVTVAGSNMTWKISSWMSALEHFKWLFFVNLPRLKRWCHQEARRGPYWTRNCFHRRVLGLNER